MDIIKFMRAKKSVAKTPCSDVVKDAEQAIENDRHRISYPNLAIQAHGLLQKLMIRGSAPYCDCEYSLNEIEQCLKSAEAFLQNDGTEILMSTWNEAYPRELKPISDRQQYCADIVSQAIISGDYSRALHELFDCVDDYARGQKPETIISINEYSLYHSLIRLFINTVSMQMKLSQMDAELISLKEDKKSIRKLINLKGLSIDEMADESEFPVYWDGDTNKWQLITAICSLGGCEYRWIDFENERDAYEQAYIMTLIGEKMSSGACPECYSEYVKSII